MNAFKFQFNFSITGACSVNEYKTGYGTNALLLGKILVKDGRKRGRDMDDITELAKATITEG